MTNRLILCLDGTWNSAFKAVERDDSTTVLKPTNPLKLARAVFPVDPENGDRQLTYYDSGVGSLGLYPGRSNAVLASVDRKLGGIWGAGFEANIEQAMTFLTDNHAPGEDIFIFGFSRGAAQARGLTQFIDWLGGLLEKNDAYYIPIFFRHYLATRGEGDPKDIKDHKGEAVVTRIRQEPIMFLGVWDTVMALGSRFKPARGTSVAEKSFHARIEPAKCVKHARQALAIDERRYDFRPEVWLQSRPGQTMEQHWFAGVHGNVGGSAGNDGLANCALHWIVDEAKALGLVVDTKFLRKYRAFPQDELSDSHSLFYRFAETLRWKKNRGARSMQGYPSTANLSVDRTAVKRLCSDPAKFKDMKHRYRPPELVEIAQAHKHDKEGFLRIYDLDPAKYPFPDDI